MHGNCANLSPRRAAYWRAKVSEAKNNDDAPSVTCEQSRTLSRPATGLAYFPDVRFCVSLVNHPRVCACGLRRALEKLISAMRARCSSFRPKRFSYSLPSRGSEKITAGGGIDGLHLFHADDQGQMVTTGLDLGGRHHHRHAA